MTRPAGAGDSPKFDLAFRPGSYWEPASALGAIVGNVKGQNRRRMIADVAGGPLPGFPEGIDPSLLEDELDADARRELGAIHPSWMGGEYLPRYLPGEVEIARVVLASVTQDVISIRARRRRGGRRILYRVVDEYPDDWHYKWRPHSSARPLTLAALIGLIDGAGHEDLNQDRRSLPDALRDFNDCGDLEPLVAFVEVASEFYPQLVRYYRDQAEAWLARRTAERRADGWDDDE